jgi:hypothetical protein
MGVGGIACGLCVSSGTMVFDGEVTGLTVQLEEDPNRWGPLVGATDPGIAL